MENSVKALLIAASMILIVMILTLVIIAYGNASGFFQREHENTIVEQLERFNNQFDNYSGTTIRGNEMLSMINKVIDYNVLQAENEGYEEIKLKINGMDTNDVIIQFKYDSSDVSILKDIDSKGSKAISEKVEGLLATARQAGISNITESKLQTLSANISNVVLSSSADDSDKKYRNKLIKNTLNIDDVASNSSLLSTIENITKQYYQLTQFKRAYFKCTEIAHSKKTGRVIKMIFELVVDNGNVKFD